MWATVRVLLPFVFVVAAGLAVGGGIQDVASVKGEVQGVLDTQAAAWNRGDLDAFCAVYAEDASFVTPKGVTTGRATILARYRTSYPDRAAMGTLTLDVVEARALATGPVPARACSLIARWRLAFADGTVKSGLTLLVLDRPEGGWRIVHDASM